MSTFDEFVHENFDAYLHVVTEAGGMPRKGARSVVHAIRRRRAVRAGTATGVSVLAVGVVALGVMNLRPAADVTPAALPAPPVGAPSWCDLTTYPAVNPEALDTFPYAGRIWANATDGEVVYVNPDGVKTVLEPDRDGYYYATSPTGEQLRLWGGGPQQSFPWSHMAWDIEIDGSGAGRPYFVAPDEEPYWGEVSPALLYEWTTAAPSEVPQGVDGNGIMNLQLQSLGFSLSFGANSLVPVGTTLEQVLRWVDGRESVTQVDWSQGLAPLVEGENLVGLQSVSLRVVGLPEGESYEVTSVYDPTKSWAAACGIDLGGGPAAPPLPDVNWGPYFEGPESAVFQCLAVLPREDEDVIPISVETGTGTFSRTVSNGAMVDDTLTGDFGTGGVLLDLTTEAFPLGSPPWDSTPPYPGWGVEATGDGDNAWVGSMAFGALAWIDGEDRLIGREVTLGTGWESVMGGASHDTSAAYHFEDGSTRMLIVRKDLATAGVACDGVDSAALASASVVWIQGLGPDADHMTWSWTRVWPPAQD